MKKQVLKSPGGLWYSQWDPEVESPLNRLAVVCIGGSGEFGSYAAADMVAEVSRITEKNGFAQDAAAGEELPFIVISPLATKGRDIADHRLIASEIANVVVALDVDYRIIGGLSLGGQTTAGFLFQALTSTEITNKVPSSYKNAEIFDGFFMLAGQAPVPTNPCAFPDKPVFMAHAIGDTAIKIANSFTMMRALNACPERTEKIYANYAQKWGGTGEYYVQVEMPADAKNKLWVIPGGSHYTSWNETYNWRGPAGTAGYEFRKWVERICVPKEIEDVPGTLIKRGAQVIAKFEDGQEVIIKP